MVSLRTPSLLPRAASNSSRNGYDFLLTRIESSADRLSKYGLQTAFSEIERLSHEVTSSGNPITMNLKTRYVVKGIGMEQTIASVIKIYTDDQGKISKVEDKWDGKLPESSIANVSLIQLLNPLWWVGYGGAWLFWLWSFVWYTRLWLVGVMLLFVRPIDDLFTLTMTVC